VKSPARNVALLALASLALTLQARIAQADTVLITGANSGIGLEFAKEYAARGWTVVATHHHDTTPVTLAALSSRYRNVRVERLDVTDAGQIQALASKLENVPIDVLINNAGVYNDHGNWRTQDFGRLDFALMDTIMAVNVKGPLMVSEAFVANVKASREKKIINISSTNGSLTEPLPGDGAIFYRASKAALNREMQLVALALKRDGIIVVLMHPGAVLTERQAYLRGKYPGMVEMPFTVHHMIDTIAGLTLKDTGRFMLYDGSTVPW